MRALIGGTLLLPHSAVEGHAVIFDEQIQAIVPESQLSNFEVREKIDVTGGFVSPGFINIHVHGGMGADVMDATEEALSTIGAFLQSTGVTAYLPTTLTAPVRSIENTLATIRSFAQHQIGSHILGVHLEGPYIAEPFKGAHDERYIALPNGDWVRQNTDMIKIVTFAPELDAEGNFTETLTQCGIVPSLGHSGATCSCAMDALKRGACSFTHLFNAMSPLHHREPGMVGAALGSDAYVELITDNIHVSPHLYEVVCRAKGTDKIIVITDSMRAAGLPNGNYDLGGLPVTVKDGAARIIASGVLAGSVLRMDDAIRNMHEATKRPLWEITRMATQNPARLLKKDSQKGSIAVGFDADFAILDTNLRVKQTIQAGNNVYLA